MSRTRAAAWANAPTPPAQPPAPPPIEQITLDQARMVADLLRDQAEQHAVDAQKRRTDALRAGRNGQAHEVTRGRLRVAEDLDDTAAELFALADWTERQAQLTPAAPPERDLLRGWLR